MNIVSDQWYEIIIQSSSRSIARVQQRKFIIFLGVTLLILNLYAPGQPNITQRLLASLIIVLSSVPTLLWLSGWDRGIPFVVILGYIYAANYALPIFLLEQYTRELEQHTREWVILQETIPSVFLEKALMLSCFGLCTLFIGYYSFQRILSSVIARSDFNWKDYRSVKVMSVIMGCIGMVMYILMVNIRLSEGLNQIIYFMSSFIIISIVVLYILQLRGHLTLVSKSFLWGVIVPTRILIGLATGATGQGFEIVLLLILVYATLKHSLPWKVMIAGAIVLLILRPVQVSFRALTWTGEQPAAQSPIAKVVLFLEATKQFMADEDLLYADAFQLTLSRLAHLMTFAEVIEATPEQVPFWGGDTLYPLLFKPIPRFLYPDKPIDDSGQTFGHRYHFLAPDDLSTSYNLPQLVEFYGNFGVLGVLAGMFFLGTIYRILQCMFVHPGMGLGAVVAGVYIARSFLGESSLSMMLGGLFWSLIFLGLAHIVMKITERYRTGSRDNSLTQKHPFEPY